MKHISELVVGFCMNSWDPSKESIIVRAMNYTCIPLGEEIDLLIFHGCICFILILALIPSFWAMKLQVIPDTHNSTLLSSLPCTF